MLTSANNYFDAAIKKTCLLVAEVLLYVAAEIHLVLSKLKKKKEQKKKKKPEPAVRRLSLASPLSGTIMLHRIQGLRWELRTKDQQTDA